MSAYCQDPVSYLLIFKKGRKANSLTKYASDKDLLCGKMESLGINKQGIKLMDLEPGEYMIMSAGGHKGDLYFKEPIPFTVESKKITYIGSFKVKLVAKTRKHNRETNYISVDVLDLEVKDKEEISNLYPKIFEEFKYTKLVHERSM